MNLTARHCGVLNTLIVEYAKYAMMPRNATQIRTVSNRKYNLVSLHHNSNTNRGHLEAESEGK